MLITAPRGAPNGGINFEAFLTCDGYSGTVSDLIFAYPNQPVPSADYSVPFVPTFYPFTIAPNYVNIAPGTTSPFPPGMFIERCTIFNAYNGILVSGRALVDNVYVGAYNKAVQSDYAADSNRFQNVRVAPLWNDAYSLAGGQGGGGVPSSNADVWCMLNEIGFTIGRSDAFNLLNCAVEGGLRRVRHLSERDRRVAGQLVNPFAEATIYSIRLRGPTQTIRMVLGDFVPNVQLFFFAVGGTSVVAGDVVTTVLTPPVGSAVTVNYTVTSANAGQPTLAARWAAVAQGLHDAIAASAAVTGGTAFLKMNPAGLYTGSQGSVFSVYNIVNGATLATGVQPSTVTIALSATSGHTTLRRFRPVRRQLVCGTWFRVEPAAAGSTYIMDGMASMSSLPNQLAPQVAASGCTSSRRTAGTAAAAHRASERSVRFPVSRAPICTRTRRTLRLMVGFDGGTNVKAFFGNSTAAANQIGGTSGTVRLDVNGQVTFTFTTSPTLYPYTAGETS